MPKHNKMARMTRRKGRGSSAMSVEGLHASFERVDKKARAQIMKGATDSALANCIRHAWSEQFHAPLSGAALKGMVGHYRQLYGAKVRKTRKAQKGGMASMDWGMGQGVSAAVYGRFPVEASTYDGAVKSLDRFYENPVMRGCDGTGSKAAPQTGGGLFDAFTMNQAPVSVPRTALTSTITAVQGRADLNPPADAAVPRLQMSEYTPQPFPVPSHSISSMAPIYNAY
jgi:hypothetical protein